MANLQDQRNPGQIGNLSPEDQNMTGKGEATSGFRDHCNRLSQSLETYEKVEVPRMLRKLDEETSQINSQTAALVAEIKAHERKGGKLATKVRDLKRRSVRIEEKQAAIEKRLGNVQTAKAHLRKLEDFAGTLEGKELDRFEETRRIPEAFELSFA